MHAGQGVRVNVERQFYTFVPEHSGDDLDRHLGRKRERFGTPKASLDQWYPPKWGIVPTGVAP